MLKDDTKEQISLFDLPEPEKQTEKPLPPREKREERPATTRKTATQNESARPVARRKHGKEAPKPTRKVQPVIKAAGPVPEGDVRLTANIREELHLKLKIAAATRRTTIGELIEELVETYL